MGTTPSQCRGSRGQAHSANFFLGHGSFSSSSVTPPTNHSPSNPDPQNAAPSSPQTSESVAPTVATQAHDPQLLAKSALQISSGVYDPPFPRFHTGRLRVLFERGSTDPLYIWWGPSHVEKCKATTLGGPEPEVLDWKCITTNLHEALIVSFVTSAEPHQIGCLVRVPPFKSN